MIESVAPERSYFQLFWSLAAHPGKAIDSVLNACVSLRVRNPIARELNCVEYISLPADIVRDKKLKVFCARQRHYLPMEKSFVAPFGIIESSQKGDYDYDDKSARIQRQTLAVLGSLGYQELREFHSLEYGYYHWHYRPARSKSRKRLVAALKNDGFRWWKEQVVESAAPEQ
jgi:hypothetical protein